MRQTLSYPFPGYLWAIAVTLVLAFPLSACDPNSEAPFSTNPFEVRLITPGAEVVDKSVKLGLSVTGCTRVLSLSLLEGERRLTSLAYSGGTISYVLTPAWLDHVPTTPKRLVLRGC